MTAFTRLERSVALQLALDPSQLLLIYGLADIYQRPSLIGKATDMQNLNLKRGVCSASAAFAVVPWHSLIHMASGARASKRRRTTSMQSLSPLSASGAAQAIAKILKPLGKPEIQDYGRRVIQGAARMS